MSSQLIDRVRQTIQRHALLSQGDTVVVGVSGGADSLCLLHVLLALREDYSLRLHVAHLNHKLRGSESDADADSVAHTAALWGLDATVESCDVAARAQQEGLALEEAAREARYAFLTRVARRLGARRVAVGHNADDQVETVIMHWLRGSGLAGLRGMLPVTRLDELRLRSDELESARGIRGSDSPLLIRPLLQIPRKDIEAYCAAHSLEPRFDRSNLDPKFYRNRLRHELLPTLESFNPRIREVILRSASILSADYEWLHLQVLQEWQKLVVAEDQNAISFSLPSWRALPLSLQRSVLREAIHRLRRSLRNINWAHVENALPVLQSGHTGMAITLPGNLEARIVYEHFTIALIGHDAALPDAPWLEQELPLLIPGDTSLPNSNWYLSARVSDESSIAWSTLHHPRPWQTWLDYEVAGRQLELRPRRTGDRFWPQGRSSGDKPGSLNHFMTSARIPRSWRDHIPLLASAAGVLWLPGWRIDERVRLTPRTKLVLTLEFLKRTSQHNCPVSPESDPGGGS